MSLNKPRLFTRRAMIQSAPARWKEQYYRAGTWGTVVRDWPRDKSHQSAEVIYLKLMALDLSTVKREAVDEIIGNSSWTDIRCDACEKDVAAAVEVGQPSDWESATATICRACLARAVALVENV